MKETRATMDNEAAMEVVEISGGQDQLETLHLHLQNGEIVSLTFSVPVTDAMYHCFEQLLSVKRTRSPEERSAS